MAQVVFMIENIAARVRSPINILAVEGLEWQSLPEEPAMGAEWLPRVKEDLVRELAGVPEVIGLYSSLDSEGLDLWVLVRGEAPDLEYRVAAAMHRVWDRQGYREHELSITSRPELVPSDAEIDFERSGE